MLEYLRHLFGSDFMPHGQCWAWEPWVVWMNAGSDVVIALAYALISITLLYFIRRREDLAFSWMFAMFGTFIFACGATHAMDVYNTFWPGVFRLAGAIKFLTAVVSLGTGVLLLRLIPKALALPSPAQLQHEVEERKRHERLKDEFISIVSHELRTPLTSIRGSLGLLKGGVGGTLNEKAAGLVDISDRNADRLLALVNDLLDMQRITNGRLKMDLQDLELVPLVKRALELNRAYAEEYGVQLELEQDGLATARIRGDESRVLQILANLISNASKFSPQGGSVTVNLEAHGTFVRVAVQDQGPGIPDAFAPHVFEPFRQADASDARQRSGTGLGLSITKALVEQLGGGIGFENREGAGARFHVDLPRA